MFSELGWDERSSLSEQALSSSPHCPTRCKFPPFSAFNVDQTSGPNDQGEESGNEGWAGHKGADTEHQQLGTERFCIFLRTCGISWSSFSWKPA